MDNLLSLARILTDETKSELKKAWRSWAFIISTIFAPIIFYVAYVSAYPILSSNEVPFVTYGVFATLGPPLFGFGITLAIEKDKGVLEQKRASPLPPIIFFTAKFITCLSVSGVALAFIYIYTMSRGMVLLPSMAVKIYATQLFSIIPMSALGAYIGMRFETRSASAILNILYIILSIMGGLWFPLKNLPALIGVLSWITPSFNISQISLYTAGLPHVGSPVTHLIFILLFTALLLWLNGMIWSSRSYGRSK